LGDFHADLIFEEFGVSEGSFVEDEDVGEGGGYEVEDCAEDPGRVRWIDERGREGCYHVMRNRLKA